MSHCLKQFKSPAERTRRPRPSAWRARGTSPRRSCAAAANRERTSPQTAAASRGRPEEKEKEGEWWTRGQWPYKSAVSRAIEYDPPSLSMLVASKDTGWPWRPLRNSNFSRKSTQGLKLHISWWQSYVCAVLHGAFHKMLTPLPLHPSQSCQCHPLISGSARAPLIKRNGTRLNCFISNLIETENGANWLIASFSHCYTPYITGVLLTWNYD